MKLIHKHILGLYKFFERKLKYCKLNKEIHKKQLYLSKNLEDQNFGPFYYAWEQRKLGDFGKVQMNKRIFKNQTYTEEEIPFYKIGTFGGVADSFITRSLFEDYRSKYPYPQVGDVLISASGSIGKTVEFTGKDEYFQDSNIVWLKHNSEIDNKFLKHYYTVINWDGIEGSTIKRLYNSNILNTNISKPNVKEQKKIGKLFDKLDDLITLHQRKSDKFTKLTRASKKNLVFKNCMVKLPKITDAWEQRKYEDIGYSLSGGNLSYNDLNEDGINKCILYGELYTQYDTVIKDIVNRTNKFSRTIYKNDILFPQSTTVDALSLISPACMNEEKAETGGVFIIRPYKNIDGNFIAYYTKGNNQQRLKLSKKAQGLTIVHLYYQSIKDETLFAPKYEEQTQISQLLLKLDNLITLHQRELEKLQNLKKAYLEKMFV